MGISRAFELAAAYLLHERFPYPEGYPHPVKLIGRLIELTEKRLRPVDAGVGAETYAGCVLAGAVAAGTYLGTRLLMLLPGRMITETLLIYSTLTRREVEKSALLVAGHLEQGDLGKARAVLETMLGLETEGLDEYGISQAAVESLTGNFVYGVLAPLLWASAGGAPAALAFKAISALDAMIAEGDERDLHLGRCASWLNDLASYPASRASAPMIAAAAAACGYDGLFDQADTPTGVGTRRGLTEMGEGKQRVGPRHIRDAARLINVASLLGLGLAMLQCMRRSR